MDDVGIHAEQVQWSIEKGWVPGPPGGLGGSAQAVLAFGSAQLLTDSVSRQLGEAYPHAPIFGCSTAGEFLGARLADKTLAVTAIGFDHSHVRVGRSPVQDPGGPYEAAAGAVKSLCGPGLQHVFVLAPGNFTNGAELVSGINSALPPGATASGGFAGADHKVHGSSVWSDGTPDQQSVVALGLYGSRLKIGRGAGGGWSPFGPERLITKSFGRTLCEFDGRSALSLYREYLGDYAQGLPFSGLRFPIGLRTEGTEHWQLRAINGIDEAHGGLTFDTDIPEGTYATIMSGNAEHMVAGAAAAARQSLDELGSGLQLAVIVSCFGRRVALGQRTEEELEAMRDVFGLHSRLTGFYSHGEISRGENDARTQLYNETMTVTTLAEE